jgi:hypothetical protein
LSTALGKPVENLTLTYRSEDLPQGGDEHLIEQQKAVLKPQNLPDNLPHLSANGLPNNLPLLSANSLSDNLPHLSANNLHLLAKAPTPNRQSSLLHSIEKATYSDPFAQRVILLLLTGGSLMTDGRVTQNFWKEKMRSNNSNKGNWLLLWGILLKLMSSNVL